MIINVLLLKFLPILNKFIINIQSQNLNFFLIEVISINKYYELRLFFFYHHLHNYKEQNCISFFHFYQKLLNNLNFYLIQFINLNHL